MNKARAERAQPASRRATRGPKTAPQVLVIDDDPLLRRHVRQLIERLGLRVIEAQNGDEGFVAALSTPPDVVVLDWLLPDREGIEVLRRLKADLRTAPIPVIMVTGGFDPTMEAQALDAGASGFLSKPWPPGALQARIRAALGM